MTNFLYKTELDGMKTILTEQTISNNDYVYIKDDLYVDDITFFKNKKTSDYSKVDLKLVKLAEIKFLTEEEQTTFKNNKLYSFESVVFTSINPLNKNQILNINNQYYVVENIIKHQDKPLELELNIIPFITAVNMYTILQTNKETFNTKVYGRYPSYREAINVLWRLREKRDENYYHRP